jgi:hypothetical protein
MNNKRLKDEMILIVSIVISGKNNKNKQIFISLVLVYIHKHYNKRCHMPSDFTRF